MGSVGFDAPLMPSQDFYVNDHAGVIEIKEREVMLETAHEIYEKTGVRAVVLTVESFNGLEPADYAGRIFDSWQLGEVYGVVGAKGILILLCTEERHIVARTNTDVTINDTLAAAEKLAAKGKFSDAVSGCFYDLTDAIYAKGYINGGAAAVFIEPERLLYDAEKDPAQKPRNRQVQKRGGTVQLVIITGIFALVMLSAFLTRKKALRISRSSAYYKGMYQRTEYLSLTAKYDFDDYPTGFGGAGNRKAIYGEDVVEADDIRIIKRGNKGIPDTSKQDRHSDI